MLGDTQTLEAVSQMNHKAKVKGVPSKAVGPLSGFHYVAGKAVRRSPNCQTPVRIASSECCWKAVLLKRSTCREVKGGGRGAVGVSLNFGYPFGGSHNEDYSTLRSILGSPCFGKLPCLYLVAYGRLVGHLY